MNFFRSLPPIALIPLIIVYFGIDELAKIVTLFYAAFFASVIVMYEGDRERTRCSCVWRARSALPTCSCSGG